jgi:hypothetical protein
MIDQLSRTFGVAAAIALAAIASNHRAIAQGQPPRPRPGLTAQQTKEAIKLAGGAMTELRKKTEGATNPGADLREYVVGVELLDQKEPATLPEGAKAKAKPSPTEKAPGPRAVVTSYRYFDDLTVFSIIDLATGRVVDVQAAQHMRTPLSEAEFEEARDMAREKSEPVKQLLERFGDQVTVYPQFSQFTVKGDPRVHRVVHLTYRVGKRELSYPRPQVDLTTRELETPQPQRSPAGR